MTAPACTIIAGPNGAGKTTFALSYLREGGRCQNFVNADLIASGLAPLDPQRESVPASRLFLSEIRRFIKLRETFAFETTLAGRSYLKLICDLVRSDWRINLIYLWLPSVELCQARVAERVAHGGHIIPKAEIARRYPRSVSNLLNHYSPICTSTICLDNSEPIPKMIFTETASGRVVENEQLYAALQRGTIDD